MSVYLPRGEVGGGVGSGFQAVGPRARKWNGKNEYLVGSGTRGHRGPGDLPDQRQYRWSWVL